MIRMLQYQVASAWHWSRLKVVFALFSSWCLRYFYMIDFKISSIEIIAKFIERMKGGTTWYQGLVVRIVMGSIKKILISFLDTFRRDS
jgi:hypothetical protein